MKKTLLVLLFGSIFFEACKEDHTLVNLNNIQSADTTYVLSASAIPPPDQHNVLIEDFTGVTCANCPIAHDNILVPFETQYHGRINIMEMFGYYMPQTSPNAGQKYNGFRDSVIDKIMNGVYNALVLIPISGIDRMPFGLDGLNNTQVKSTGWNVAITNRLTTVTDSINLSVYSSYNAGTGYATIVAKVTYLQPTTTLQNLSIAVVEDSFTDYQDFPDPTGVQLYNFNGVFRDMVTQVPFGTSIFPTLPAKEAGRVCQKVYYYHLNPNWIAKHCRVIAFVHGDGSVAGQTVYQSWQAPVAP